MELNEIIQQRIAKLDLLKAKGISLYPAFVPAHITVAEALGSFNEAQQEPQQVTLCGRVTALRSHGKASFLDLKDITGRIQLYIKRDLIGEEKAEIIEFLDIADFVAVTGEIFKTHTGEITIKVRIDSVVIFSTPSERNV